MLLRAWESKSCCLVDFDNGNGGLFSFFQHSTPTPMCDEEPLQTLDFIGLSPPLFSLAPPLLQCECMLGLSAV